MLSYKFLPSHLLDVAPFIIMYTSRWEYKSASAHPELWKPPVTQTDTSSGQNPPVKLPSVNEILLKIFRESSVPTQLSPIGGSRPPLDVRWLPDYHNGQPSGYRPEYSSSPVANGLMNHRVLPPRPASFHATNGTLNTHGSGLHSLYEHRPESGQYTHVEYNQGQLVHPREHSHSVLQIQSDQTDFVVQDHSAPSALQNFPDRNLRNSHHNEVPPVIRSDTPATGERVPATPHNETPPQSHTRLRHQSDSPHQTTSPNSFASSPTQMATPRRRGRKKKANSVCSQCGLTQTPEWRRGPEGVRTLCNACGLYFLKLVKKVGTTDAGLVFLYKKIHDEVDDRMVPSARQKQWFCSLVTDKDQAGAAR